MRDHGSAKVSPRESLRIIYAAIPMSRRFKTPAEFNDTELRRHKRFAGIVGLLGILFVFAVVIGYLYWMAKGTVAK